MSLTSIDRYIFHIKSCDTYVVIKGDFNGKLTERFSRTTNRIAIVISEFTAKKSKNLVKNVSKQNTGHLKKKR